jgi:hypothetical protein
MDNNHIVFELKILKVTNYTTDELLKINLTGKSLTFDEDGKVPLSNYKDEENVPLRAWMNDNFMIEKFIKNNSINIRNPIEYEGMLSSGKIELTELGNKIRVCDLEFDCRLFGIKIQNVDYELYISGEENYYGFAKGGWDSDDYLPLWVFTANKSEKEKFYILKFYRSSEFMSIKADLNLDKKIFIPIVE